MDKVDLLGIVLIAAGCLLVYGSEKIMKLFKAEKSDSKLVAVKLAGLTVGAVGCLRIFGVL